MLSNPTLKRGVEWRENQKSIVLQQTYIVNIIFKQEFLFANLYCEKYYQDNK
jgi:hypothetical protein